MKYFDLDTHPPIQLLDIADATPPPCGFDAFGIRIAASPFENKHISHPRVEEQAQNYFQFDGGPS